MLKKIIAILTSELDSKQAKKMAKGSPQHDTASSESWAEVETDCELSDSSSFTLITPSSASPSAPPSSSASSLAPKTGSFEEFLELRSVKEQMRALDALPLDELRRLMKERGIWRRMSADPSFCHRCTLELTYYSVARLSVGAIRWESRSGLRG